MLIYHEGLAYASPGLVESPHSHADLFIVRSRVSAPPSYNTYLLLLDWPVPIMQTLAGHRDSTVMLGYWRDPSALLLGDACRSFREAALKLGFEAYGNATVLKVYGGNIKPVRHRISTPRCR